MHSWNTPRSLGCTQKGGMFTACGASDKRNVDLVLENWSLPWLSQQREQGKAQMSLCFPHPKSLREKQLMLMRWFRALAHNLPCQPTSARCPRAAQLPRTTRQGFRTDRALHRNTAFWSGENALRNERNASPPSASWRVISRFFMKREGEEGGSGMQDDLPESSRGVCNRRKQKTLGAPLGTLPARHSKSAIQARPMCAGITWRLGVSRATPLRASLNEGWPQSYEFMTSIAFAIGALRWKRHISRQGLGSGPRKCASRRPSSPGYSRA